MAPEGLKIGGLWAEIGLDTTPLAAGQAQVKAIVNSLDPVFGALNSKVAGLNAEFASMNTRSALGGLGSAMKAQTLEARQALNGFSSDFVSVQSTMAASAIASAKATERAIVDAEARKAAAFNNTIGVMRSTAAAFGIYLGAQTAVRYGGESMNIAMDSERVYRRLGHELGMLGGAYKANLGDLKTWFDGMQYTKLFMEDEMAGTFQSLVLDMGDYNKALKDLPLAMNLAAAKGISLASAADAIAKAEKGATKQLTMLIPQLRGSLDPLGDLTKLLGNVAPMDTYEAKVHRIAVATHEFKESVGAGLIENLTPFVDLMERLAKTGESKGGGELLHSFVSPAQAVAKFYGEYLQHLDSIGLGRKSPAVVAPPPMPKDEWADYYLSDEQKTQYGMDTEPLDYAKRRAAREGLFAEGIVSLNEMESTTNSLHATLASSWKDMLSSARGSEAELEKLWDRYADAQNKVIADQKQADIELGMSGTDAQAFAQKKLDDLDAEHAAFIRNSAAIDAQVSLYKNLATSGLMSASNLKAAWADYTAQRIRQINDEAAALAKTLRTNEDDPRVISFKNVETSKALGEEKQYYAGLKDSVASGLRDVLQANNLSKDQMQDLWTDYEDLRMEQIDAEVDRQVQAAAAIGKIINPALLRESMGKGLKNEKLDLMGTELEKWTAGTGQRMRETFSEFFFDAQKGDWQSWQSYVESVYDSLMRSISDDLADMVVDWINSMAKVESSTGSTIDKIIGAIGGLFGGGGGGGGGSPIGDFPVEELPLGASGGVTKGPTIAGEAGPEAIIPLSKFRDPAFMEAITGRGSRQDRGDIRLVMHVHGVQDARSFQESESQIMARMYARLAAADARNG